MPQELRSPSKPSSEMPLASHLLEKARVVPAQGYDHTKDEPTRDFWRRRSQDSGRRIRSCPEKQSHSINSALAKETPLLVGRVCRMCAMSFPSHNKLHCHQKAGCSSPSPISAESISLSMTLVPTLTGMGTSPPSLSNTSLSQHWAKQPR